jgi:uncharacterized SAM-binding protein YcdF (DUF218 family)
MLAGFAAALVLATLVSVGCVTAACGETTCPTPHEAVLKRLIAVTPLPAGQVADVAYVLGGNQGSLESKYQRVAELYHQGAISRIWILARPGVTEYSRVHRRNLSNDEWSIAALQSLGVPAERVELVTISGGFFGTLAEARAVSGLVRERGIARLLLVAQLHHTRRVRLSFAGELAGDVSMYIQSSDSATAFHEVLVEWVKLEIYRRWLA